MKRHDRSSPSSAADQLESTDPPLQGEGNYTAARRHRKSVKRFLDDWQGRGRRGRGRAAGTPRKSAT